MPSMLAHMWPVPEKGALSRSETRQMPTCQVPSAEASRPAVQVIFPRVKRDKGK
jgi:hypothetical protein